jgi:GNAT superfamily N-acetyltransferase
MPFSCRRISSEETYPLRHLVLGHPPEANNFPRDPESVHFGAFDGAALVSIVTAHREPRFGLEGAWRIRGMATHPSAQGTGAGGEVLQTLLTWGRLERVPLFWCNARERAIPFYLRHGFSIESELFDIKGVGPHKVMKRAP